MPRPQLAALVLGVMFVVPCLIIGRESASGGDPSKPKRVLLLGQRPDGHPPSTHEYMAGQGVLAKCLAGVKEVECTVVQADSPWPDGPQALADTDAAVLFLSEGARWVQEDSDRLKAFQDLRGRGAGLVALHWAMGTREAAPIESFVNLFGGCHGGPDRSHRVFDDADLTVADREHPVTRGIGSFRVREEFYYRLKFVKPPGSVHPILQMPVEGNLETVAWSWERPDGGRSFGFSGLHFHSNWRFEQYRRLVVQSVLWTLRLPIPQDGIGVPIAESDLTLSSSE